MSDDHNHVTLLLGGGLDSTTLIPFYRDRGAVLQCVHFDYGQTSFAGERRAAQAICRHYAVPLRGMNLGAALVCDGGEYRGRNAILLLAAASMIPEARTAAIGIHAGGLYYDSSRAFVADIQRLFDGYFAGVVGIEAPFIDFSKRDVFDYGIQAGVPFDLTFSCERASHEPCRECPSCLDRVALIESV